MKKFIAPEVKVMMVDMTINCMSGGDVTFDPTRDNVTGPVGVDEYDAPTRGIFD